MSFKTLTVVQLRSAAEQFGVDLGNAKSKKDIIAAFEEEGVDWGTYETFSNAEKSDEDVVDVFYDKPQNPETTGQTVLVKMDRANPFFQTGTYTFTIEHPFVAMKEEDAQDIFDTEEGFRVATPNEVKQYYS